jgi:ADP-heptose:LPS heptosyltransferase
MDSLAERTNVVLLDTGLVLDEHADYSFGASGRVVSARQWMTPANNLGVQTQIIAGAQAFIGTCGSLAWLAPMLGTDTLAVYADDHFLTPHLYAARHAYNSMQAARFTAMDLAVLDQIDAAELASVHRSA